jgi:heat shock protein HslJ
MKIKMIVIAVLAIVFGLYSCNNANKSEKKQAVVADNSQNSLDWEGTYSGIVPCADCMGISVILNMTKNADYSLEIKYIGKSDDYIKSEGKFIWSDDGNSITLDKGEPFDGFKMFKIEENKVKMLDTQGAEIVGELANNYILNKVDDQLVEKYWKLKTLNGEDIQWSSINGKEEPHIILRISESRVSGNGGCNGIIGSYETTGNKKIKFTQMVSTMKACPNMEIENAFLKSFEKVASYEINKSELILKDVNNNEITKFEVVYL